MTRVDMEIESTSLILIAIMNNRRDLEIARVLGWYRIPLRSAPKVISVDYLAFYQTSSFGRDKWRIRYIAPVRGHELVTRAELLRDEIDHPHANHEYYKIQLGPLEQLDSPVPTRKWRRITFFYTTGEYFNRANTVDELVVQSSDRPVLWRALRERIESPSQNSTASNNGSLVLPGFDLDPEQLVNILGIREFEHPYEDNKTGPDQIA